MCMNYECMVNKGTSSSFTIRSTQRQFSGYICSEDEFEIRNFRNICCKISCLPAFPRIFEHLKNGTNINHKGLQRTANGYAEERRIYKDLISKNEK